MNFLIILLTIYVLYYTITYGLLLWKKSIFSAIGVFNLAGWIVFALIMHLLGITVIRKY